MASQLDLAGASPAAVSSLTRRRATWHFVAVGAIFHGLQALQARAGREFRLLAWKRSISTGHS